MHHGANHLARRKKLAAVGILLTHFQQQIFIHLRQGKEMRIVDMIDMNLVHLIQNIAQIGFAIHTHPSIFQYRHEPERRWYVINDSGSDGLGFID